MCKAGFPCDWGLERWRRAHWSTRAVFPPNRTYFSPNEWLLTSNPEESVCFWMSYNVRRVFPPVLSWICPQMGFWTPWDDETSCTSARRNHLTWLALMLFNVSVFKWKHPFTPSTVLPQQRTSRRSRRTFSSPASAPCPTQRWWVCPQQTRCWTNTHRHTSKAQPGCCGYF